MYRRDRASSALALLGAVLLANLPSVAIAGSALSDRVVVIEADARSHTVQHTLVTEQILLVLNLPGSIIPQRVSFGGPERAIFASAHERQPGRIALWSGNVLARYRHQYGDAVTRLGPDRYRLQVSSWPQRLEADLDGADMNSIESVQTWVFPSSIEVTDWEVVDESDANVASDHWSFDDNTLVWSQQGTLSRTLRIDYQISRSDDTKPAAAVPVEQAIVDEDADSIPDERDVCLGSKRPVDEVGCPRVAPRILIDVTFETGKSRLTLQARKQLNRTARAMQAHPEKRWEVAAFTDDRGTANHNRALSARRAEAVRHYLLLRDVPPASVQATGFGENSPIADNTTTDGRARNRRIELRDWPVNSANAIQ